MLGHDQQKMRLIFKKDVRVNGHKRHDKNTGDDHEKEAEVAKRGLREERETIIRFDETEGPVVIYTFNADLKRRLKAFAKKYPELCIKTEEDTEYGSMTYELEKTRLQIRFTAPYSTERRQNASECVRKNRELKISDK